MACQTGRWHAILGRWHAILGVGRMPYWGGGMPYWEVVCHIREVCASPAAAVRREPSAPLPRQPWAATAWQSVQSVQSVQAHAVTIALLPRQPWAATVWQSVQSVQSVQLHAITITCNCNQVRNRPQYGMPTLGCDRVASVGAEVTLGTAVGRT
eukprot:5225856-Prymnesium_polylepis.1